MVAYYRIPNNFNNQDICPWLQEMMHEDYFFTPRGHPCFHHANHGSWHPPTGFYGSEGCCKFLRLLRKVAFIVLSLFIVSTVVRFVLFLIAMLFSPPMLLLFFAATILIPTLATTSCPHSSSSWWSENSHNHSNRGTRGSARNFQRRGNNGCFVGQWPTQRQGNSFNSEGPSNRTVCRRVKQEGETEKDEGAKTDSNKRDQTQNSSSNNKSASDSSVKHRQRVIVHRDETDEALTISLDVPGFGTEDVQIRVKMEDTKAMILEVYGER